MTLPTDPAEKPHDGSGEDADGVLPQDRFAEMHIQIQHALVEELNASVEKYRVVVNNLDEVAFQLDTAGTLTFVNDSWLDFFGSSPESVLGHSLAEYMAEGEDRAWLEAELHPGAKGSTSPSRESVAAQEGHRSSRTISMIVFPELPCPSALSMCRVKDGWVGSIRDLSKEIELDSWGRHAAKMETLARIGSTVAHDFNNLLTVINGNLELIQMSAAQDERSDLAEMFGDVFSALDDGAVLVDRLQSHTSDQVYQPRLLNTGEVLTTLCARVSRSFGRSISIEKESTPDLLVRVDERALTAALLSIAQNARDAMEHGGTLSIRTRVQLIEEEDRERFGGVPTGEYVAIEIQDTGRGIPTELLSRIMEPFFTADTSGPKSGLGLSMVNRFLERAEGGLEITSCVGRGTTVTVLLPHIGDEDTARSQNECAASGGHAVGRVLLIEDSDRVRKFAKHCLSQMGYEVVSAHNGVAGLEQLHRSGHFDLVFSDVVMPGGVSGHDVAARVEELCGPMTLILLTSGYITENQRGASDHWSLLRKPYTASQLDKRIQELMLERDART